MNLLSPQKTAEILNVSLRSLERWRGTGDGPAFVRVGARRIAYRSEDVQAWLAARSFPHRAAEMAAVAKDTRPVVSHPAPQTRST